tara:strand:- start:575 stop:697 length:123 start_codon:yes stop_codon:yes gene_type:complete
MVVVRVSIPVRDKPSEEFNREPVLIGPTERGSFIEEKGGG